MHVWRREAGDVRVEIVPFSPLVLVTDPSLVADAPGLTSLERLDGPGDLAWLARFATWGHAIGARDRCRERAPTAPGDPTPPFLFPGDAVHQFLLTTGHTSFGDLVFGDVRRLALDIEVMTTDGFEFPSAARSGDRIIAVALADSTGYVDVIRGDRLDERELLEACTAAIRARDPDVIEGHNIFRFDLEYLEARARRHGVTLAWGRDGSALRGRPTRLAIAERTIGYRRYEIGGRHIVDTWMLAQLHDAGARDLPAFGLKDLARHFGVAAAGRTYVDGASITSEFRNAPDRLMAYAADDARETLGVSRILAPPYFAQAQVVPFDYQSSVLRGAAAKIDALLLREYLQARHAVPRPRPPAPVGGGHVAIFHQGVARDVLHVDVTSLYPSLMVARGIAPASDSLGSFLTLLRTLRDFRLQAKRDARDASDPEQRAHLAALQQSFKILINAFYGYLAFSSAHWNDFAAADRITAEGREVVATILGELEKAGAVPLEADTDGVYFVPPAGHAAADDDALLARIAAALPAGIHLDLDGRYAAMFSYRLKTYALLDSHGRVTLRGSGFRSRGLEPFQRRLIEELVRLLLEDRGAECKRVVDRWLDDFAHHRVPPRLFARTETLQESLEAYRAKVASGGRSVSAVYELAIASGRPLEPGDQVSYYVAGRSARVAVNENARLMAAWDSARPDENVEYYQTKVSEVWERLRPFAEQPGLRPWIDEAPPADPQLSLF
ncbi:MAG: DNA polymerase II [Candidatus Rokubacteria bacterium]|nr:DNA polymerase II [Candidatus Rokubacteria bacterium]